MDTTFVTAYYPLDRPEAEYILKPNEYIEQFKRLVNTGINIVFFHDTYGPTLDAINELSDKKNLTCILRPLTTLNTYDMVNTANKNNTIALPVERNYIKDTIEYMTIMLSKLELVSFAKTVKQSSYYAWIDVGIFKIVKQPAIVTHALNNIPAIDETKICIPGCWNKGTLLDTIYDRINWRFCGGFFIGTGLAIESFYSIFNNQIESILKDGKIIWETNVWALCEQKLPELFNWFKADHNDSMLIMPKTV